MLRVAVLPWLCLCALLVACAPERPTTLAPGRLVVLLGSSSAAGLGASSRSKSWASLLAQHARATHASDAVWNLARPGFTTFNVLPPPVHGERRARLPNERRNITRALSVHPYAIILSLPTNDTLAGVPFDEQQRNFERLADEAGRGGALLYVMSSQPRNFPGPLRDELFRFRAWLAVRFAPRYIDVWPGLVGPANRLREDLDTGDGTHVNDAGHLIIASQVAAADVFGRRRERETNAIR